MNIKKTLFLLPLLSVTSFAAAGDSTEKNKQRYFSKWEYGGHLATMSLNADSARREGLESDAWTIGFSANYDTKNLLTSLGLDFVSYDDNNGFTQETEDNYGNQDNSSSSASAMIASVATGPKYQFGKNKDTMVFAQGGLAWLFGSERSISNCTNCYSESIDIKGGLFVKAGIVQNVGAVALGLNTTQYVGSEDIKSSVSVSLSTSF